MSACYYCPPVHRYCSLHSMHTYMRACSTLIKHVNDCKVQSVVCSVQCAVCRVQGAECGVQCAVCRVWCAVCSVCVGLETTVHCTSARITFTGLLLFPRLRTYLHNRVMLL